MTTHHRSLARIALLGVLWLSLAGCDRSPQSRSEPGATTATPSIAITHVAVVDVVRGRLLPDQTVIVAGTEIVSIGPSAQTSVPAGVEVVDGAGRFLSPGFADMHVHLYTEGDLFTYVANGVTTVRNMAGDSTHLRMRRRVNEGVIVGPRIVTAGPVVEAAPLSHPDNALVERPSGVRAELERQRAAGYDFVKVYNHLDRAVYDSVVAIAAELGMPVSGHVPQEVGLEHALALRQRSIEHFRGYIQALMPSDRPLPESASFRDWSVAWERIDTLRIPSLVERSIASGVWNVPTFSFTRHELSPATEHAELVSRPEVRYLSLQGLPTNRATTSYLKDFRESDFAATQRGLTAQFRLLRALDAAGAEILAGTDSWLGGYAFADEMELLVRAGLTPARVLRAATFDASRYLGEEQIRGTVAVGRRADLVLLDANPLIDISAVRRVQAVVVNGRLLRRADLDARLSAIADTVRKRQ